jgi:Na+-driven multidrug efflux pump
MNGAKKAAPKLIACSFLICVGVGGVMAACSGLFPMIYNTSDNVRSLAASFILISALTMPIHGMLHSIYFTLRSGGKTFITFLFDSGFAWLISVPTVYCLAHFTDLNIIVIYFICQILELLKCMIGYGLIKSGIWLSNIVDEEEKVAVQ